MTAPAYTRRGYWLTVLAATVLAACQAGLPSAPADDRPQIVTLAAGTQCGYAETAPAARWHDDQDALLRAYRDMTRQSLGAGTLPARSPDFSRYGVLQVFMGQQASAGYQLRLLHPYLESLDPGATVRIEWLSPAPGAVTLQVLTSPCLLLAVPRAGFRTLTVTDQAGHVRASADL